MGNGLQVRTRSASSGLIWVGLAVLALSLFSGCRSDLPASAYLIRYEAEALSQEIAAGYRISVMVLTSDYLLAQQMDSTWGEDEILKFRKTYQKSVYLSLRISPAELTGGPDDLKKDILGGAMLKGQGEYQS